MRVALGKIASTFGLKGEFECFLYSNLPPLWSFARIDGINATIKLLRYPHRSKKDRCLCSIEDVFKNPEDVKPFVGKEIWIYRDELPKISSDEVYLCDVVGLPLVSGEKVVGHVISVHDFGAGIVLEVEKYKNNSAFEDLPFFKEISNYKNETGLGVMPTGQGEGQRQSESLLINDKYKKWPTEDTRTNDKETKKTSTEFIHWNEVKLEDNKLVLK